VGVGLADSAVAAVPAAAGLAAAGNQ